MKKLLCPYPNAKMKTAVSANVFLLHSYTVSK